MIRYIYFYFFAAWLSSSHLSTIISVTLVEDFAPFFVWCMKLSLFDENEFLFMTVIYLLDLHSPDEVDFYSFKLNACQRHILILWNVANVRI